MESAQPEPVEVGVEVPVVTEVADEAEAWRMEKGGREEVEGVGAWIRVGTARLLGAMGREVVDAEGEEGREEEATEEEAFWAGA